MRQDLISVCNMRESDRFTIEHQTSSIELMGRAAICLFKCHDYTNKKVLIVTGKGNNGGDGFALAEILLKHGIKVLVSEITKEVSKDSQYYRNRYLQLGGKEKPIKEMTSFSGYDVIVDCLLGTGFKGAVREDYKEAIEKINASSSYVLSCDINSGLDGDLGTGECVVKSDKTLTIGYFKKGLILNDAPKYIKDLMVGKIGITLQQEEDFLLSPDEFEKCSSERGFTKKTGTCLANDGHDYFTCPAYVNLNPVSYLD